MIQNQNRKYLIALTNIPDIGPARGKLLIEEFPDLAELFSTHTPALEQKLLTLGLTAAIITALKNPNWATVDRTLAWAEQPQHHLLAIFDHNYPVLLKEIARPPLLLFINGNPEILNNPQIAMVGSRKATPAGAETAYSFAAELATAVLTITSGFALGIDAKSHQGALSVGGKTIAVLGTGIDCIYPRCHFTLAEQIISADGALISEFPLNTAPQPNHFPQRNRIISGLCLGTLVVEAALKSGSLITARLALEQNRDVFAIPGSIYSQAAKGCNALISQGAKLVETASDILEEIHFKNSVCQPHNSASANDPLDINYQKLLECIGYEATSIDVLISRSTFAAHEVASMLLMLELTGRILAVPGGYVKR